MLEVKKTIICKECGTSINIIKTKSRKPIAIERTGINIMTIEGEMFRGYKIHNQESCVKSNH